MAKKSSSTTRKSAARKPAARAKAKPTNMSVWKGIVTKAWKDPAFRSRLIDDPHSVLAEHGFAAKKGRTYRVVADTKDTKHLILPESARTVKVKPVRGSEPDPGF